MNRIVLNNDTGRYLLKREAETGLGVTSTLGEFATRDEAIKASGSTPISTQEYVTGKGSAASYENWLLNWAASNPALARKTKRSVKA